jgi:chromosome segregation ATPase
VVFVDYPRDSDHKARLEVAEKYLAEANEDCREKAAIIDRFVASETELMVRCVAAEAALAEAEKDRDYERGHNLRLKDDLEKAEKRVRELEIDRDKCQRNKDEVGAENKQLKASMDVVWNKLREELVGMLKARLGAAEKRIAAMMPVIDAARHVVANAHHGDDVMSGRAKLRASITTYDKETK